jgi:hypothetical protein
MADYYNPMLFYNLYKETILIRMREGEITGNINARYIVINRGCFAIAERYESRHIHSMKGGEGRESNLQSLLIVYGFGSVYLNRVGIRQSDG